MTEGWRYLGTGLPYLNVSARRGCFIALEGGDSSGCTTQTRLLATCLRDRGYRVLVTGARTTGLAGELVAATRQTTHLGRTAKCLLHATALAGELESRILPDLQAGEVVLADRYAFGLMARDAARDAAAEAPGFVPHWLQQVYGFALLPDLVLYVQTTPEERLHRVFANPQLLDTAEGGMDLELIRAGFGRCLAFQEQLQDSYALVARTYGFAIVDGEAPAAAVHAQIRDRVLAALGAPGAHPTQRSDPQLSRVLAMCDKYRYEEPHCTRVAALARHLFDLLQPLHGLGADQADLLRHGALLHDIGRFLHPDEHHIHGAHLIRSDRLLDEYPAADRAVLALLTLNHRGEPTPPPPEWAPERAQAAMQLSAILRLADGLDRERRGGVHIAGCRITPRQFRLRVRGLDLKAHAGALKAKTTIFPLAFGRVVRMVT